jgi:hypothetical protein
MNVARFNCPACETPIEAPANSIASGVRCPQCDTGFVPNNFQMTDEPVPAPKVPAKTSAEIEREIKMERQRAEQEKVEREKKERSREADIQSGLEQDANNCFNAGSLFLLISILVVFIAFANQGALIGFEVAGGFLSASIICFFFAQLLHIRAALQKLYRKE